MSMFMPYEVTAMQCNAKSLGYNFEYDEELNEAEFRVVGDPDIHTFVISNRSPGEMILFLMTMVYITGSWWRNLLSAVPVLRKIVFLSTTFKVKRMLL